MIRNREIQTFYKTVGANTRTSIGGPVASGKKRYVTFIQIDPVAVPGKAASACRAVFASRGSTAVAAGSLLTWTGENVAAKGKKLQLVARATKLTGFWGAPVQIPKVPNPNCPLFSILGGKYLYVAAATGTSIQVFVQYFDE